MKNFKLKAEQIKPLAKGFGGCIATDMITVEGKSVEPKGSNLDFRHQTHVATL